jgi:oligopeptide/dipeptide ABC transporter ATP-binding protein
MPLLRLSNLHVRYGTQIALHDLTIDIAAGETLGLLGESGSGKSTLGRTAIRLQPSTSGTILFDGNDITNLSGRNLATYRRRMQMVFEDPMAALNSRQTIITLLEKPLALQGVRHVERQRIVNQTLDWVGLPQTVLTRHPHTLSGGELQRVVIARALSMNPEFVVCDEAVSALDVSVQAQILNLLCDLRREKRLTYLFISHDLDVIRYMADRVAVLFKGRLVEIADYKTLWHAPLHPYTRALISELPRQSYALRSAAVSKTLNGRTDDSGCPYRGECPLAFVRCLNEIPGLQTIAKGHQVACHATAAAIRP